MYQFRGNYDVAAPKCRCTGWRSFRKQRLYAQFLPEDYEEVSPPVTIGRGMADLSRPPRLTTVKDSAMDRIRLLVLISGIALTSGLEVRSVCAQELSAGPEPCLIIGDVGNPDAYPVRHGHASTSQLVNAAGMGASSANVTIIRPGQIQSEWSEFVRRGVANGGSAVRPGDILIVRSAVANDAAVVPSAALVSSAGTFVLTLDQAGVSVADVLTQCHVPMMTGSALLKLSSSGVQRRQRVTLQDAVVHGDVLAVTTSQSTAAARHAPPASRVTEFPSVSIGGNRPQETGGMHAAVPATAAPFEPLQNGEVGIQPIPSTMHESHQASRLVSATEQDTRETPPTITLPVPAEAQQQRDPFVLAATAQGSAPVPNATIDTPHTADDSSFMEQTADDQAEVTAAMELSAPLPPDDPVITAGGFGLLNTLFVSALLLAGSLIVAGWVKSELTASNVRASQARGSSTTRAKKDMSGRQAVPPSNAHPVSAAAAAPKITRPQTTDQDSLAATAAEASITPAQQEFAASVSTPDNTATVAPQNALPAVTGRGELVAPEEFFGDWRKRTSTLDGSTTTESSGATVHGTEPRLRTTEPAADQQSVQHSTGSDTDEHRRLEDLIQNRLEVDLRQADLPLRISLFGRPAGPRRLRIDAAHESIPAPHFAVSETQTEGGQSRSRAAVPEPADASIRPTDIAGSNSLDRALNYLNRRVKP
jgi:hypothetical protein